jgi:hypothetical protein
MDPEEKRREIVKIQECRFEIRRKVEQRSINKVTKSDI